MRALLPLTSVLLVGALAGCSTPSSADDGRLQIVASTDVYGSIAEAVGGDLVSVTSIISGPAQDPHSYEATAQDRLALASADLVLENGGGYDPFIDQLLDADGGDVPVLTAVEGEGHDEGEAEHEHVEGVNEHVWYDLHAMTDFAQQLAEQLGELDAANAGAYTGNADAFAAALEELEARAAVVAERVGGKGVAVTEPVPLYLLEEAGLVNRTPEAFTEAIEEGSDVPPSALQETLEVITDGGVALLAYNEQTASTETERVLAAAQEAGIPVVDFTETLPDGRDYVSWMTANLDAIESALP